MQWLKDFVSGFFGYLLDGLEWLLNGLLTLLKQILLYIFDGALTVITLFIQAIDFSTTLFTTAAQWSNLPSELIYLINIIGIPQAMTLLVTAIIIRVTLNLIPGFITRV